MFRFLAALLLVTGYSFSQENATVEKTDFYEASVKAADSWLKLVDAEKYEESWNAASPTFKLTIPQKNWVTILESIRKPFGKMNSRKILEQRKALDPKGLPKGNYMVLFYTSSFSKKDKANELVTLSEGSDGVWKVLTYQIQ